MVGKRSLPKRIQKDIQREHHDEETGPPRVTKAQRFRDIAHLAVEDARTREIKRLLKEGAVHDDWANYRKSDEELKAIKNKKVRQFYENQNDSLNDWVEVDELVKTVADHILDSMNPDADHDGIAERQGLLQEAGESIEQLLPEDEQEKRRKAAKTATWTININVIANIILLIAKCVAAFYSNSLSLIASLVDSALDLLCTLIVWTTNRLVQWRLTSLRRRFPVGRRRLEPIGILVFSIIMVISFLQVLKESVEKLLPGGERKVAELPPLAAGSMLGTIIIKGIIWFACIRVKTTQVQALAQDCKTDVYFNTLSLLFPFIGYKTNTWWLDPVGAALLSLFIIYDWSATCFENITRLSGSAVDDSLQKKLTFLAYRFSPVVDGFKNLTAYHAGDGVWAEYDLLLDEKTPLRRAHDIAETLQYCAEGLSEVDRAFVTTDYTSQGPTGHAALG